MSSEPDRSWSRRDFLGGMLSAGTAGFLTLQAGRFAGEMLGTTPRVWAAEPPLETNTVKLIELPAICIAPLFVAEAFLRAEGFTEVLYIKRAAGSQNTNALASGEGQFSMGTGPLFMSRVDAGDPIVLLAGVHVGCYELFGTDRVRGIRDLKGKTVAVPGLGTGAHLFLASMVAYVGLDPRKDINWVAHPFADVMRLLAERKVDAFLAFPPEPQELRAKKIGHVLVNTMMDRPWSEYFCCMLAGNREFVQKHPVATKRVLRAILRATDACAREPVRVARFLVDRGYAANYDFALATLKDIPYDKWREYSPENTLRFYALRLQEVGLIKNSPQKIITQGTDWRFLNELKKEMRG